jgi:hypothetical protein
VVDVVARIDPLVRGRIYVEADLENSSPTERARYPGFPTVAEREADALGRVRPRR